MSNNIKNLASIAGSNTATEVNANTPTIPQTNEGSPRQFGPADYPTPAVDTSAAQAKLDAMKTELLELELEEKRLAVKAQKANLVDLQERLDEREMKRETVRQKSVTNGATLRSIAQNEKSTQTRCNHRKGGNGVNGIIGGQGDDPNYAILVHSFCNGDKWIRCMRCGKTWKPPVESAYTTKEAYLDAYVEYKAALNFPTRNTPSGSVQFRFSDNGAYYREVTKDVTLR